jgi:galactose mutarotase-like enzyme
MNYTLKNEKISCTFSDIGGELISAKDSSGTEFIWQGLEPSWKKHAPFLFPICGRLKDAQYTYGGRTYDMSCHGFLSGSLTSAKKIGENEISFELSANDETRAVYPFDFFLTITYTLEDTTLSVRATVKNTSADTLPFMFGGHPGFSTSIDGLRLEDFYVDFAEERADIYPIINETFISSTPETYIFWDGKMPLTRAELVDLKTVVFKNTSKTITLASEKTAHAVKFSYSDTLPYMCLWSDTIDEGQFICLEPWSGVPSDGVKDEEFETRGSMVRLAPGESETFSYTMTFI